MELQFTKKDNLWVATAEVSSDYNVRLECMKSGLVIIKQSTVEGREGKVVASGSFGEDGLYEQDYVNAVYPKYVTIECNAQPKNGYITVKQ